MKVAATACTFLSQFALEGGLNRYVGHINCHVCVAEGGLLRVSDVSVVCVVSGFILGSDCQCVTYQLLQCYVYQSVVLPSQMA